MSDALRSEIKQAIVRSLRLPIQPEEIGDTTELFGAEGLGLDSIDILEVALVISKRYGLQLKADSEDNHRIFSSLRSLTHYVASHQAA